MRKHFIGAVVAFLLPPAVAAFSQPLQTAYFLDNYVYSYQINPAIAPENVKGFFAIGIGNIGVSLNTNFGLNSVVFPITDGSGHKEYLTGFDSRISSSVFPGQMKDLNKALTGVSVNVLSFGVGSHNTFYSFELNVKGNAVANAPKELLSYIKSGMTEDGNYSFDNASLMATEYVELVNGFSYKFGENFSLGGRLKILAGLSDADFTIDHMRAGIDKNNLALKLDGGLNLFAFNKNIPVTQDGVPDLRDFTVDKVAPGGFGAALDIGVQFRIPGVKGLSFSLSALDLGGIFWKKGLRAVADGSEQLFDLRKGTDVDAMAAFKVSGNNVSKYIGLDSRLNAGVRYQLSRMFSLGAIVTSGLGRYKTTEGRAGVTFTPGKIFSLAASAGFTPYGTCVGCAMSLKVPGFNLFIGTDSIVTSFTKDYIPSEDLRTRLNLGLAIAF